MSTGISLIKEKIDKYASKTIPTATLIFTNINPLWRYKMEKNKNLYNTRST